jgi:hypothetical protein
MDDAKWERAAGAGGILFVLIVLVSAFLPGTPPMTNDPAREIAKWFADQDDAIRRASFLGVIATIPFVWWGAAVYRMLERATGNARLGVMAAVGIALGTAAASVASVILAVVGIVGVAGAGGLNGTRFFYLLATNLNAVVGIGTALLVSAVSAGILRTGMMPKFVGWFGVLVALLAVGSAGIVASTREVFMTLSILGFLTFALWLVIVSVLMIRRPAESEGAAT